MLLATLRNRFAACTLAQGPPTPTTPESGMQLRSPMIRRGWRLRSSFFAPVPPSSLFSAVCSQAPAFPRLDQRLISSSSVGRQDQDPPAETQQLQLQIHSIEAEIKSVGQQIADVESEIKATTDPEERKQLRDEKNKLRDEKNKLRDEKNILLSGHRSHDPTKEAIPLDDLNKAVEVLRQRNLLRSPEDRQTKPFKLVPGPVPKLMNRELAWAEFFNTAESRYNGTSGGTNRTDKTFGPIVTAFGGPGSGKSRFLDELASPQARADVLAGKPESSFLSAMRNAVGVSVTFNGPMPYSGFCPQDKHPIHGLALRVFYSYFVDHKAIDWSSFTSLSFSSMPNLVPVLNCILDDIDTASSSRRHLLLCIDETKMGVDNRLAAGSSEGERAKQILELMGLIGATLDLLPRVHIVLSSLFFEILEKSATESRRGVRRLSLSPLSPDSVAKLYGSAWQHLEEKQRNVVMQLFRDAGGSPRLLFVSNSVVGRKTGGSLESLRTLLASEDPIRSPATQYGTPGFLDGLIIALRGEEVKISENERGIMIGLLMMQAAAAKDDIFSFRPSIAPSVICCLQQQITNREADPTAYELLRLTREFLEETKDARRYQGEAFEEQFRLLWQIRCLAFVARLQREFPKGAEDFKQDPCQMKRTLSLRTLLVKNPPVAIGRLFNEDFDEGLVIPGLMKMVETDTPQVEVGTFWSPTRKNFEGVDGVSAYERPNVTPKPEVVLGFQYKYSALKDEKGNTVVPLGCDDVARAIIRTYQHHKALRPYIDNGTFGFVFAAHRNLARPAYTPAEPIPGQDLSDHYEVALNQKIETLFSTVWKDATAEDKKKFLAAPRNLVILDTKAMTQIMTLTLARTAPFPSEKPEEEATIKNEED